MSEHVEFVCPICGEEFAVGDDALRDPTRLLLCPCCGATGVEPWDPFGEESRPATGRAA
jgi:DNA-directed RNA polymerase subunit RPC12/RpoP